uniref:Uncharacterized protein n=1 Tax=Avena sativa TaxID=4498 RepID=A0ACD5U8P8_AVESA
MAHQQEDDNGGYMSAHTHVKAASKDIEGEEAACSSSLSEHMDEDDDFFQIEGPILSSHFLLGAPADQSTPVSRDECPDPKRIPSSVFERSKSTTPTDWSVTSNESLFSISVGNTSFSKDHLFLYGKSGEMGNPNEPLAPLPPLLKQIAESSPTATGEDSSIVKQKAPTEKGGADTDYINSLSHRSDGSTTSFTFPILTGDERSNGCLKDDHELARQSIVQLSDPVEPHDEKNETPKAAMMAPNPEEAPVPVLVSVSVSAEPPPPPATTKMFPCCSCCPFCC